MTLDAKIDELSRKIDILVSRQNTGDRVGGIDLACEVTGYKKSTIYSLVHKGEIPFLRKRKRLIFKEHALRSWMVDDWLKVKPVKTGRKSKLSMS